MSDRDKDDVWEHGENMYLGWRCKYCNAHKGGGGSTSLKQHLAGRGSEVVHWNRVSPDVRAYFQRDIEKTKKVTAELAREKLRREAAASERNNPGVEYDEEAEVERAMNLSRAEEEYRRGWNKVEVHTSMEGGVVRRGGMLCRGCLKEQLRIGRVQRWRTITWHAVGKEE